MITTEFNFANLKGVWTGPRAFAPGGFLIFVPLYFVFSVLLGTRFSQPITVVWAVAANLVSLSACALIFFTFYFTAFRNRLVKPVNIVWLFAAGATLGFSKGAITGAMYWVLGTETDLQLAIESRAVATTILGVLLVFTQPILISFRDRYKHQRDTLVAERVKLASTPREELSRFTAEAREQLNLDASEKPGFLRSSDLLRRIIQDDLRPLSHRIWEQENSRYTDFTFRDLYRLSVTKYAFPWGYVAPVYFVTALSAFVARFGLKDAVLVDLIVTMTIILCFSFARLFTPKHTVSASFFTLIVVILITYLSGAALMLIFNIQLDEQYFTAMVGNGAWIWELTVSGALLTAAVKSHAEIERELVQLVGADSARKDSELLGSRLANRELAQYLHGHVQNQLIAAALRIEQAENANDPIALKQELDLVDQVLADAPAGFQPTSSRSLTDEMKSIEMLWGGLLAVSITVDPTCEKLKLSSNLMHDLTQAANEAITNAMRHGFASEVSVTLSARAGNIELIAIDNGTGPRSGGLGLGSALFNSLAGSRWSLTPAVGGGSVLSLKIKV
jgi:signal transduction histidine kinase